MSDWKNPLYQLVPQRWRGAGKQRNQRSNADTGADNRVVVTDAEKRLPEREEASTGPGNIRAAGSSGEALFDLERPRIV